MEECAEDWFCELIKEAVDAGVYRKAARLNHRFADLYDRMAAPHSQRAAGLLDDAMNRLGAGNAGPCSRCGE